MNKLIIIILTSSLLFLYQNCSVLETETITDMSSKITGVASINGESYILNDSEMSLYLQAEQNYSGYSKDIPTQESQITDLNNINLKNSINLTEYNYLCMVGSAGNSTTYYPLAFYNYESVSDYLVPICMTKLSCVNIVSELGAVKPMLSELCSQNSLAKSFNSEEVLQLVKRY